ncbi:LacI family DNA-binding transcriptional regulator [Streptomyces sp. NPDC058914]|uniref:LacI family DNA-binding transcriptional regulator n=1 Tax=Streptomyces sp. NPDC058914 TaxID=3346671 RepID=UPI00369E9D81
MKDVAREAGVSLGAVSNVLNRPEVVAETTRTRVLGMIDSLGHVRAEGARQLRGRASRVLAVMVFDLVDPFCTALASGAEQAAREADLGIVVRTGAHDPAQAARHLSSITSHRIRGAVVASGEGVGRTVAAFRRNAVPFVVADQNAPHPAACSVGIHGVAGGQAAVRHLIERGHRSIAHVSGPDRLQRVRDRRRGALAAVVPLTSVRRPAVATGRRAGRLLIEDTVRGAAHEHAHVVLRPELLVRRSTMGASVR